MAHSTRRKTTEQFIQEAQAIIGNEFDFSNVVYKNLETAVDIKCNTHGWFTRKPRVILQKGYACPSCAQEKVAKIGESRKNELSDVINRANVKHDNFYDYSLSTYENCKTKTTIICPLHGQFQQTFNNHLRGQGCPKCGNKKKQAAGGYNLTRLKNRPDLNDKPAIFYVTKISYDNDTCYKVGITTRSIKMRFSRTEYSDFVKEIVIEHHTTLKNALLLEQEILAMYKDYKFYTNRTFSGYTECIQAKEFILEEIQKLLTHNTIS